MDCEDSVIQDNASAVSNLQEELCGLVQNFAEKPGSFSLKKEQIEDLIERLQEREASFDPLAFLMARTEVAEIMPIGFPNNEVDEILLNHSEDIDLMLVFFQKNELRNKSSKTFGFIWSRILDLNPRRLPDLVASIPEGAQRIVSVPNVKQINLKVNAENAAMWHEIIVEIFEDTKRADAIRYAVIHSCIMNCPHFSDAWDALKERINKLKQRR
jgi:hypothetical protein